MNEGIVKYIDEENNFGFIKDKNSTNEYYVQLDQCIDKIKKDDNVIFNLRKGHRGLIVINVKVC